MLTEIPRKEFEQRVKRIQQELVKRDLDVYLVHASESEFANVYYLSNYWVMWESAGVLIPQEGDPILLVGPESEQFAKSSSVVKKIRQLFEYKETSEPAYPGFDLPSFKDVLDEVMGGKKIKRFGLGDYQIMTLPVYDSLKEALDKDVEIIRAEDIISKLRTIKSENEIAMMRKACKINEKMLDEVLGKIKPGMTEHNVHGMIVNSILQKGATGEGMPSYVMGGKNTRNAICRPTHREIKKNELIQIDAGARYGGYASSIGRVFYFGKMPPYMKKVVQFGLDAHLQTYEWIREGVTAREVAEKYYKYFVDNGFEKNFLYGPCHGCGIIEVEKPWMETNEESNYLLEENMTFNCDTFNITPEFGLRWEDGFRVTKNGVEQFSDKWQEIIEL